MLAGWIILGKTGYVMRLRHFIPRWRIVGEIYRVGGAAFVRAAAQFVAMGVVNRTAASFGVAPLAVMGVLMRVGRFVQMPLLGLGQGMIPVVSYNFGAGKRLRLGEVVSKLALAGSAWALVCWLAVMVLPGQVVSVFGGDEAFLSEGSRAIRLFALMWFAMGLYMIPGFFFQGIGRGVPAIILVATQNLVFLLVPVLVLSRLFGLGGLWTAFAVADALGVVLALAWLGLELRRREIRLLGWLKRAGSTEET